MAEEKITKTLSSAAFAPKPGEIYEPYISHEENIAEFTLKAVIVGAVFGIIFGAGTDGAYPRYVVQPDLVEIYPVHRRRSSRNRRSYLSD